MRVTVYAALAPSSLPPDEAYVAVIDHGKHLRAFTYGATQEEAQTKADAHIAAARAKAEKYRKPKGAAQAAEVEEAI